MILEVIIMLINGKQNGKKKLSSDYYFELLFLVRIPEKFTYTFLLSSDQVSSCIVHGGFSISDDDTLHLHQDIELYTRFMY